MVMLSVTWSRVSIWFFQKKICGINNGKFVSVKYSVKIVFLWKLQPDRFSEVFVNNYLDLNLSIVWLIVILSGPHLVQLVPIWFMVAPKWSRWYRFEWYSIIVYRSDRIFYVFFFGIRNKMLKEKEMKSYRGNGPCFRYSISYFRLDLFQKMKIIRPEWFVITILKLSKIIGIEWHFLFYSQTCILIWLLWIKK